MRDAGMSEEDGMTKIYRDSIKYWEDRARTADKRITELEKAMENFRAEAQLPWHYFRSVLDKSAGVADE